MFSDRTGRVNPPWHAACPLNHNGGPPMPRLRTSTLTGLVARRRSARWPSLEPHRSCHRSPTSAKTPSVTPVAGPSWLTHLGVPINRTFLGQGSGRYGPPPDQPKESRAESLGVRRTIDLTGADLYRLNCQACHGESGRGTPPEIKSRPRPRAGIVSRARAAAPPGRARCHGVRRQRGRVGTRADGHRHASAQGRHTHAAA